MPQLDPTTFQPQLIWLAITFLILYLVMAKKALPRVEAILSKRAEHIADDLDGAEKMKRESESLESKYEEMQSRARAQASEYLRNVQEGLKTEIEAKKQTLEEKLGDQTRKAEQKIARAKNKAMADLEDVAIGACLAIVDKISGAKPEEDLVRKTVQAENKNLTRKERG